MTKPRHSRAGGNLVASSNPVTDHLDLWSSAIVRKSGVGRGRNGKVSAYGVQKLRELILELAVRGKLVPQDPNDESASVLLKKIAEEKAQLIKEGKIKNQKIVQGITVEEVPFELPTGWEWARFPDVSQYKPGKTPSTKNPVYWSDNADDIPWVSISDMEHFGLVADTSKKITQEAVDQVFKYEPIPAGSLLMSFKLTVGKIAILDVSAYHNEAIISIQPFTGISRDYLFKFLPTRALAGNTKRAIMGNTLNATSLSLLLIPVPPLAEQHRIVAKVDELMTLCDQLEQQQTDSLQAHQTLVRVFLDRLVDNANTNQAIHAELIDAFDTLFTTEESIGQLKQTILQLAVMGKLVPQNPNDEPASELLEKMAEEKALLIKEKKIRKRKILLEVAEEEKLFQLPAGWEWARFGEVTVTRLGKMLDKAKNRGTAKPYLRNTNVQWHRFELDDIKEMKFEEKELDEFRIRPGDLLICEGGEPGRCAIWRDSAVEMYFQKAIHRARVLADAIPEYLEICLANDAWNGSLNQYFTGATIKHFPGDKVSRYVIPLPPAKEQYRIVAKVDELMALCGTLKARIQHAQITQTQLADAVVEQAIL